jgi:site-specific recombinase XerD
MNCPKVIKLKKMVSFYLRDKLCESTSIGCSVNYPGQNRIWFSVKNTKIHPKEWAGGRMMTGRGKTENGRVQDRLNELKKNINNFYEDYYDSYRTYPTRKVFFDWMKSNQSIKDFLPKIEKIKSLDFFQSILDRRKFGRELTKGKRFSTETITHYNSFIKSIKGFQEYSGRKCFFLEEFKSKKLIEQYEIYLTTELNMMINSIHNKMKTLKSFLQVSVSEGLIPYNPFKQHSITLYTENSFSVVFTKDEMLQLESLDFSDNPDYDRIRDQYLIYLWSGVRKSDLKNLLRVIHPDSKNYVFKSEKTGEICEIPAFETLKKVAEKYNYNFPEPISDIIVLKEIKHICKMLPTMNVTIEKSFMKGGTRHRDILKKHQMIVIHTARRTLATILVEYGLPYEQVMKITGHKKLSTLQKYIKSDLDIDLMLRIGDKIKNG